MDANNGGADRKSGNMAKIIHALIARRAKQQGRAKMGRWARHHDRVAVRCRLRDMGSTNGTASTAAIIHHHRTSQRFLQNFGL